MKRVVIIASILCCAVPLHAATNNTPHALDCMAKNGFTHEMWVAKHAGTNAQVQSYIACRDGISIQKARAVGRKDGNFDTGNPSRH
ncbi:hypothetical protein JQ631_10755 [Bradyrhizobium manausense]|jgi:hypothetical protein|uniref:hypothetical protein n=1 Tax=Bradyrhizobium manausense TaxID=989370 RepID=UPI001BAA44A2|nr:hypothetical protein [Bradyrhizobium manausense]MBR0789549.1 hypothetical protein [Bradyrhizobium manausense]